MVTGHTQQLGSEHLCRDYHALTSAVAHTRHVCFVWIVRMRLHFVRIIDLQARHYGAFTIKHFVFRILPSNVVFLLCFFVYANPLCSSLQPTVWHSMNSIFVQG